MTDATNNRRIELRDLFRDVEAELDARLGTARRNLSHPGAKGEITESEWRALLTAYLPRRYSITKGFVVDSRGGISDEIDLIIHDRHFSPLLFHHATTCYIPAEAVYAVLEVKPELSATMVRYAGDKAASVRCLHRTSGAITHAGGEYAPNTKPLPRILAGIVTMSSGWVDPIVSLPGALAELEVDQQLDIGCVAKRLGFRATYSPNVGVESSNGDTSLIYFVLRLLGGLQTMGSAPPIDFDAYAQSLHPGSRT